MFLLFTSPLFCQSVHYGFKGGWTLSKFSNTIPYSEQENFFKNGAWINGFVEVDLGSSFNMAGELGYSGFGNRLEYFTSNDNSNNTSITEYFSLNYLNFHILVKYYLVNDFSAFTGLNTSILLSADLTTNSFTNQTSEETSENIKEYLSDADLGIIFGLSYVTPIGILVEGKYNLGLVNIVSDEFQQIASLRNLQFALGVGYRF
jgi:hypothetical protein